MKKRNVTLKKLALQKKTIANMNANSVQGGTGGALETQIVIICATTINTDIVTIGATVRPTCVRVSKDKDEDVCMTIYKSCDSLCIECMTYGF